MIDGKKVLAVITARGGSKGLPGKNVRPLCGKPLVAWTVEAARHSQYLDRTILSSDDAEIIAAARAAGCDVPFVRPAELATDTATSADVLRHALASCPEAYDLAVLLQPTSPLRRAEDIDACVEACLRSGHSAVTVVESPKPPQWMYRIGADNCLDPVLGWGETATRRQDLPPCYALNGAVYAVDVQWFLRTGVFVGPGTHPVVMPAERSVDIDVMTDFLWAELLLRTTVTAT